MIESTCSFLKYLERFWQSVHGRKRLYIHCAFPPQGFSAWSNFRKMDLILESLACLDLMPETLLTHVSGLGADVSSLLCCWNTFPLKGHAK